MTQTENIGKTFTLNNGVPEARSLCGFGEVHFPKNAFIFVTAQVKQLGFSSVVGEISFNPRDQGYERPYSDHLAQIMDQV